MTSNTITRETAVSSTGRPAADRLPSGPHRTTHTHSGALLDTGEWSPASWRQCIALQQPVYDDAAELERATAQLALQPPLITPSEVLSLKSALADAQDGKCFLLQGGDCAESFADCTASVIGNRLKLMLQMSMVLMHGLKRPVIRVGRFAGQYAKPRSADVETRDGVTLPAFRGDIVNRAEFTATARRADPRRLIEAHAHSALTMNHTRALIDSGLADSHHPEGWALDWVEHSPHADEYRRIVAAIGESLQFMESLAGHALDRRASTRFYTSHEALLLHYEETQTRRTPGEPGWFNLSTHFPWIGMRTAALGGAHVEYFRGIRNPVAVKVGPSATPDDVLRLIDALNPNEEPGRLTLITRMGHARIADALPPILEAVRDEGRRVLWMCDPMHGNTESMPSGYKTRRFDKILGELEQAFDIHAAARTRLGGIHLELTGDDVSECLGGARGLGEGDLARAYKTAVDPRLNYEQALELAMLVVRKSAQRASRA
ncbi:class II 3-deoxy-7-phosphoheptulonate synthase [Burkholderia stagnalis]|uniref:class II 3-deoxy-7-phosphoheptulonate synthase n=1 Tax=Burkholderia stagnalis TaxID=1503054 RepID=UPI0019CFC7FB|nr:3-deoxy-7-phosphoheptulonate synthase class II [Burkholderia stagnalis]